MKPRIKLIKNVFQPRITKNSTNMVLKHQAHKECKAMPAVQTVLN